MITQYMAVFYLLACLWGIPFIALDYLGPTSLITLVIFILSAFSSIYLLSILPKPKK